MSRLVLEAVVFVTRCCNPNSPAQKRAATSICEPLAHLAVTIQSTWSGTIYISFMCKAIALWASKPGRFGSGSALLRSLTMSVLVASSMLLATGSKAPGGASPKPCFLSLSRKIHILPPDTKRLRWRAGSKSKKKTEIFPVGVHRKKYRFLAFWILFIFCSD